MSRIVAVLIVVCVVLVSCGSPSTSTVVTAPAATPEWFPSPSTSAPVPDPTATLPQPAVDLAPPEPVPSEHSPSPTPTPTQYQLPVLVTDTPTPAPVTSGTIEVRIPNTINMETECVNTIPFRLVEEGTRTMSRGEGRIDCTFEGKPLGGEEASIVYHVTLQFEAVLEGELLPATPDRPGGWLDAYLTLDGAIIQYYTGYPPQATNPCPESNPCHIPNSDVLSLPFAFEEGATITTPWTFMLHLDHL